MDLVRRVKHLIGMIIYLPGKIIRRKLKSFRLRLRGRGVLRKIHTEFTNCGIEYFADFGTLLGFVRERGYIAHDVDMDFSIMPGYEPSKVLDVLESAGFEFMRAFEYEGQITELTMSYNSVPIDFFFLGEENGRLISRIYYSELKSMHLGMKGNVYVRPDIKNIVRYEVLGETACIPENYDELLRLHYGNWRKKDSRWHYVTSGGDGEIRYTLPGYAHVVDRDRVCRG